MLAQRVSRLWFVGVVAGFVLFGAPGTASAEAPKCPTTTRLYELPAGLTWPHPRAACTDADNDPIKIMLTDPPEFGTFDPPFKLPFNSPDNLISIDTELEYTANADAAGNRDVMKFKAVAGGEESNEFEIDVWILPANSLPVCKDLALNVQAGSSIAIAPECTDANGSTFELHLTDPPDPPDHGTFDPEHKIYTAAARYAGQDSMTLEVEDRWKQRSAPITVTITVTPAPGQPTATADKKAPTLALVAKSPLKSRKALRRGIRLTALASEAGRIAIEARVSSKVAQKLRIDPLVGSLTRNIKAGKSTLKLKLYRKVRADLADLRHFRVRLVARMVDAAGNLRTKRLRVVLQKS